MKQPLHDGGDEEPREDVFDVENLFVVHLNPDLRAFEHNLWNPNTI
jgi:hypothetical protein